MSTATTVTTRPEPGVYPDVPIAEYLAWDAASNSQLGRLVPPSTPAHLRAYMDELRPTTKAFREGRVLHACVLEPELYASAYRLPDQCMATTSKNARCSKPGNWPTKDGAWLCTTHLQAAERAGEVVDIDPDLVTLSPVDDTMARRARARIEEHPVAAGFLRRPHAHFELSVVWDDPETGVRCKARWDFYDPDLAGGVIMDLKGTLDASAKAFARDAFRFGYYRQGTLYMWGAKVLDLPFAHYAILAVEKKPPFELRIHRITEKAIGWLPDAGEDAHHYAEQVRKLLRLWKRCRETETYPGYPAEPHDLTPDSWQWDEMTRQTERLEEVLAV